MVNYSDRLDRRENGNATPSVLQLYLCNSSTNTCSTHSLASAPATIDMGSRLETTSAWASAPTGLFITADGSVSSSIGWSWNGYGTRMQISISK